MGGLQALGKAWPSEAREQGGSESLIPADRFVLNRYRLLSQENRRSILLEIGDLLSIPVLKPYQPTSHLKTAVNEPNPTKPTFKQPKVLHRPEQQTPNPKNKLCAR